MANAADAAIGVGFGYAKGPNIRPSWRLPVKHRHKLTVLITSLKIKPAQLGRRSSDNLPAVFPWSFQTFFMCLGGFSNHHDGAIYHRAKQSQSAKGHDVGINALHNA